MPSMRLYERIALDLISACGKGWHRWLEKEILPTSSGGAGENDIRKDVRPRDDSS